MTDQADRGPEIAEFETPAGGERDGIGENDHPIPLWFNLAFAASVVFAVLYFPYYTFGGWSSKAQYDAEVAAANEAQAKVLASLPTTNPFRGNTAAIGEGQQVFASICAACHKPDGSGLVGPSLVDPYWKYGKDDPALLESVTKGRPGGMPAWGQQIGTEKAWKVLAFIETLPKSDQPGVGAPAAGAAAAPAAPANP